MIRIATAQLWVHDQDEALAFFTEKVGMEVRSDVTLPEMGNFRWLTVADLAAAARLSPAHFSREFRRAFGEAPHQYLLTRRLERAASLLRSTDWSVARICVSVGLSSVGSFTGSFGRMFGMSPTAYRAAHPSAAEVARVPACVVRAYTRPQVRTFREDAAPPVAVNWVEPATRATNREGRGAPA